MGLLWLLVLGYLGYSLWRNSLTATAAERQLAVKRVVDFAMTAALVWVAFRSGSPWVMLGLLGLLLFTRGVDAYKSKQRGASTASQQSIPRRTGAMSRQDALELLGVTDSASKQEISDRYKELMRKLHPDKGGSTALAAQLNEAKRVLLD